MGGCDDGFVVVHDGAAGVEVRGDDSKLQRADVRVFTQRRLYVARDAHAGRITEVSNNYKKQKVHCLSVCTLAL